MRNILASLLFLSFSCGSNSTSNFITQKVQLINDIGTLEFLVPVRFDSMYSWVSMENSTRNFRFADRRYPLLEDYNTLPDSVYEITISQPIYTKILGDLKIEKDLFKDFIKIENIFKVKVTDDQVRKVYTINGHEFGVITQESTSKGYETSTLEAFTIINEYWITINYICHSQNCESFISDAMRSLKSLKINSVTIVK